MENKHSRTAETCTYEKRNDHYTVDVTGSEGQTWLEYLQELVLKDANES